MASAAVQRFKLVFFVPITAQKAATATPPVDHLARCKAAVFATGAGRYPHYAECCWTSSGRGQFRPTAGARPAIGAPGGALEEVPEARVEVVCRGEEEARRAVAALKGAHPYEEPAYEVYKLEDF